MGIQEWLYTWGYMSDYNYTWGYRSGYNYTWGYRSDYIHGDTGVAVYNTNYTIVAALTRFPCTLPPSWDTP